MLLKQDVLKGIAEGTITLAFRRWKRPTVKSGGTLRTSIGLLSIDRVDVVDENKITSKDAKAAGYDSRSQLLDQLNSRGDGKVYRIALHHAGADPRVALRQQSKLSVEEIEELKMRLSRMDSRSSHGPWTIMTLELISTRPGERAPNLAESIGMETKKFKTNVRKLKELGLTESLAVGYRLSPRGEVLFKRLQSQ